MDTVVVGQPAAVRHNLELHTPLLSWGEMWRMLKTHVTAAPAPAASSSQASSSSRRIDRQALGASTSAAEVNVVTHPGYTAKDRRIALLKDHEAGQAYLCDHLSKQGALFLIGLEHTEGELAARGWGPPQLLQRTCQCGAHLSHPRFVLGPRR